MEKPTTSNAAGNAADPSKFFLPVIVQSRHLEVLLDMDAEDAAALFESGAFPTRVLPGNGGRVASKDAILDWLENRTGGLRVLRNGDES